LLSEQAPEVEKRLACDASLTTVLADDQGDTLNIGRRSCIVPRAMSHALRIREAGYRYPGSTRTHYTRARIGLPVMMQGPSSPFLDGAHDEKFRYKKSCHNSAT